MNQAKPKILPLNAMTHPLWLIALVLLIVNDHFLKAEFASAWTGKLSDFAGLLLAPILFAAICRVRTHRGLVLSGIAVASVFSLINLSPFAAGVFDASVSMVWPFFTTPDPTDLIALPMVPLGLYVFSAPRTARPRLISVPILIGGVFASIGSGPPPCDFCTEPQSTAQISVLNKTNELHVLRVRSLKPEVSVDCDVVADAPNDFLAGDVFGTSVTWLVQSGQEIPLQAGGVDEFGFEQPNTRTTACNIVLIESDTVPDTIVYWTPELAAKTFLFDADVPKEIPADPQTLVLEADYSETNPDDLKPWRFRTDCGSRADLCNENILAPAAEIPAGAQYEWKSQHGDRLHFNRPAQLDPGVTEPAPGCETPDAGEGIAWESPRAGTLVVRSVEEGLDGCHELELSNSIEAEDSFQWWLCAPFDAVTRLAPTAEFPVVEVNIEQFVELPTITTRGLDGISIRAVYYDTDQQFGDVKTVYLSRGYGIPGPVSFAFDSIVREGCAPQIEGCGEVSLPVDLRIPEALGENPIIKPGDSVAFGDVVKREIYLVRAGFQAVISDACEEGTVATASSPEAPRTYLETVIISE